MNRTAFLRKLRGGKYGVSPKEERTVNGKVFASKKEATRFCELKIMQTSGVISGLTCQKRYVLEVNGQPICVYVADFVYCEPIGPPVVPTSKVKWNTIPVVEDTKGMRTEVYKLKCKLMKAVHGIDIRET